MAKIAAKTLDGIVGKLSSAYRHMELGRFIFGDQIQALRGHGYSWPSVVALLKDRFPNAPAQINVTFTVKWAQLAASTAKLFREHGGLAHGDHMVSREQLASLGLSDKQLASLVDAIDKSASLAKGLPKLRVSDIEKAVKATDRPKAIAALMAQVDLVNHGKLAMLDPVALLHMKIKLAKDKLDKAEARVEALRNELSELRQQLPPVKQDAATKPSKPTPRRQRQAQGLRA